MTKHFPLLIILFLILKVGYSQTNVSGGIYSNTTWTKANSPYIVTDTVVVFPGVTLTIQPGVLVKFEDNIRLEIRQAFLNCQGTETDSITFTSNSLSPFPGIWDAVFLNGTNANMNAFYCNFMYANNGIQCYANYYDTLIVKQSNFRFNKTGFNNSYSYNIALIDSCYFSNNTEYGFYGSGTINYCNFSYNQKGLWGDANTIVKNTRIDSSIDIGIENWGQGRSIIDNCVIVNNKYGIFSYASGVNFGKISNSRIDSNSIAGIYIYEENSVQGDSIFNCQINYNGIGIWDLANLTYITPNVIIHNVIQYNTIGFKQNSRGDTIYCNKICNNSSYDFYYDLDFNNNIYIPGNYWGTSDSATIRAKIYDGYVNVNKGLVYFMPIDTTQCYLLPICNSPIASFSYTNSSFSFDFKDQSSSSVTNWLWDFGDGITSNQQNPTHVYASDSTYSVCLTVTDSCDQTTSCQSVYACASPVSEFTYSDSLQIIKLFNQSTNSTSLLWDYDDGDYSTQENPTHSYLHNGTYNVCLIAFNYCSTDTSCQIITVAATGISQSNNSLKMNISPNPVNDYLIVKLAANISKREIRIFNMLGELVYFSTETGQNLNIDVSNLPKGLYTIQISTKGDIVWQKFIK